MQSHLRVLGTRHGTALDPFWSAALVWHTFRGSNDGPGGSVPPGQLTDPVLVPALRPKCHARSPRSPLQLPPSAELSASWTPPYPSLDPNTGARSSPCWSAVPSGAHRHMVCRTGPCPTSTSCSSLGVSVRHYRRPGAELRRPVCILCGKSRSYRRDPRGMLDPHGMDSLPWLQLKPHGRLRP